MTEHALSMEIYSMKCEITFKDTLRAFDLSQACLAEKFQEVMYVLRKSNCLS